MSMKKSFAAAILAAAIGASPAAAVSAAGGQPAIATGSFSVNGQAASVRTIVYEDATLVSVRDVATLLGGEISFSAGGRASVKLNGITIDLKSGSDQAVVDGTPVTLDHPLINIKGTTFIDGQAFLAAFGFEASDEDGILSVELRERLDPVDEVRWLNAERLIASRQTGDGRTDYLVNAATGEYTELLSTADSSALTISPDGKQAAYADGDGIVHLVDLATKQAVKASSDASIKSELQYGADGNLYFIQGDKMAVIARLNPADGTVTKVLDDKVENKANLIVSADGTKFAYTVVKTGKVKADASKPVEEDDVAIDMTGTEPQIYLFDASVKDGKPVQLTTSLDDKVDLIWAEGSIYYISASTDPNILSGLAAVDASKNIRSVFIEEDVQQAVYAGGSIYVLSLGARGAQHVYAIDPATGAKRLVAGVPDTVSGIAANGSTIAVFDGGTVKVLADGSWVAVTK